MNIFVSYARQDAAAVHAIKDALGDLGHEVWLDLELKGGEQWWNVILERIRECDAFMLALSPESARSKACPLEASYALATNRPLLPVMVRTVDVRLFPQAVGNVQFVDYTTTDAKNAFALVGAVARVPSGTPLPDPLPAPPAAPGVIWEDVLKELAAESLGFKEQAGVLTAIRSRLGDEDDHGVVVDILGQFRRRPDIAEAIGRDIDRLLGELQTTPGRETAIVEHPAEPVAPAVPRPEPVTDVAAPGVGPTPGTGGLLADDPTIPNHRFVAPGVDLARLAGRLQNWFSAERMESQVLEEGGRVFVQGRDVGIRRAIGAGAAFSVKLWIEGPELVVEVGQMKWADKAAAAAVGMLLFWPALIPAAIGGAKPKALPNKALRVIETAIPDCTPAPI